MTFAHADFIYYTEKSTSKYLPNRISVVCSPKCCTKQSVTRVHCSSAIFSAVAHCLPIASSFTTHWFDNTCKTASPPAGTSRFFDPSPELPTRTQICSSWRYCNIFLIFFPECKVLFFCVILVISMTKMTLISFTNWFFTDHTCPYLTIYFLIL